MEPLIRGLRPHLLPIGEGDYLHISRNVSFSLWEKAMERTVFPYLVLLLWGEGGAEGLG